MTEKTERGKQRGGDEKKFIAQGSKKCKNNYNTKMSCKAEAFSYPTHASSFIHSV